MTAKCAPRPETLSIELHEVLETVAAHLPAQAPLPSFVHHNTLHPFEHLAFGEALETAGRTLGANTYPADAVFVSAMADGSLDAAAISDIATREAQHHGNARVGTVGLAAFVAARLRNPFTPPGPEAVTWLHSGGLTRALERFLPREDPRWDGIRMGAAYLAQDPTAEPEHFLQAVWEQLQAAARGHGDEPAACAGPLDCPSGAPWLLPMLMRLAAAYLDQGIADWSMPRREAGFLASFVELYAHPIPSPEPWLKGLSECLRHHPALGHGAEATVVHCLGELGVEPTNWSEFLHRALLPVRGWAAMFRQLEVHPEKAPFEPLAARLSDFVAVYLLLEVQAARLDCATGQTTQQREHPSRLPAAERSVAFEALVCAALIEADWASLSHPLEAQRWLEWVVRYDRSWRSKHLLEALEDSYLHGLGNDLLTHAKWLQGQPSVRPEMQAVFCIDDREESFRRHLEEVAPEFETFGYPGFFGVAMRYTAPGESRSRDLCPVSLPATHAVTEGLTTSSPAALVSSARSDGPSLLNGFIASMFGIASMVPLVLGVLFPRWFRLAGRLPVPAAGPVPVRAPDAPASRADGLPQGYSTAEMADLVEKVLRELGLVRDFCPAIFFIGHGSSSINNPHLAAYGCGATAGGCGGPNARAFAAMANDSDVRAVLAERGIHVPEPTRFFGGVHDTCTDDVHIDATEAPQSHGDLVARARRAFAGAAERNALERCRLFDTVSQRLLPREAKQVVEARALDLSEPRPEYNHAKNAGCVIGQRRWTRGLFLDQRVFLTSYSPEDDDEGLRLEAVIDGSVPVGVGINLEYFFGVVDQRQYGAGSKLPHNVSGLLGVMDGHKSDLRTGLYQQMVEKHAPVRMVVAVQTEAERIQRIVARRPDLARLLNNGWLRLLTFQPERGTMQHWQRGKLRAFRPRSRTLETRVTSLDFCAPHTAPLPGAHIQAAFCRGAA